MHPMYAMVGRTFIFTVILVIFSLKVLKPEIHILWQILYAYLIALFVSWGIMIAMLPPDEKLFHERDAKDGYIVKKF